jgi:hypothetical protein
MRIFSRTSHFSLWGHEMATLLTQSFGTRFFFFFSIWRPKYETRPASILDLRPWIQHHIQAAPNNFLQRIMQELEVVMKVSWNMSYFLALMVAVLRCIVHVSIMSVDKLNRFILNSLQKPPGISAPLCILPNCIQANFDMIYLLTAIGLSPGGSTHLHTNNT